MSFIEALLLALALCVDSLVVSATTAFGSRMQWRRGVLMALVFALCQVLFPLVGAAVGTAASTLVEAVDHWVAFALLAAVGGKMIADGLRAKPEEAGQQEVVGVGTMFLLGAATSIDSLAVGVGLGLEQPWSTTLWVVAVVGGATLVVSLLGVWLGRRRVPLPERTAAVLAGLVLIGLGIKIVVQHLAA